MTILSVPNCKSEEMQTSVLKDLFSTTFKEKKYFPGYVNFAGSHLTSTCYCFSTLNQYKSVMYLLLSLLAREKILYKQFFSFNLKLYPVSIQ